MFTQHIALVPESHEVNEADVARVSAAVQRQVARDFAPHWGVAASVDFFRRIEDVPFDYWPIVIGRGDLSGAPRIQIEATGQPFAYVTLGRDWTVRASQACLELLVNPQGTHTIGLVSPRDRQRSIALLVEVAAPCAGLRNAYMINGVLVSDFCTPQYFSCRPARRNEQYSATGAIDAPLQVRPGGHLTWYDFGTNSWWLRNHWGESAADTELGPHVPGGDGVREWVRRIAPEPSALTPEDEALSLGARVVLRRAQTVSRQRATRLRALLADNGEVQREEAPRRAPSVEPVEAPSERFSSYADEAEVVELLEDDKRSYDAAPPVRPRLLRTRGETRPRADQRDATVRELRTEPARVVPHRSRQSSSPLRRQLLLSLIGIGAGLASFWLGHFSEQLFSRRAASLAPNSASADASLHASAIQPAPTAIAPEPEPAEVASARVAAQPRKLSSTEAARSSVRNLAAQKAVPPSDPVEDLIQTRE